MLMPFIHDFHFSKFELNFNSNTNTIEITGNIFIDDLELAVEEKLELDGSNFKSSIFETYLDSNFIIRINDKVLEKELLGVETSEDLAAIWVYWQISDIPNMNTKVKLENKVLLSTFEDQRNMIVIKQQRKNITSKLLSKTDFNFNFNFE
jgi:hypothetical protein